jgi:hypothetical protein
MGLLDREEELAALERLLDDTRAGGGGALVLRREPGVGLSSVSSSRIRRRATRSCSRSSEFNPGSSRRSISSRPRHV